MSSTAAVLATSFCILAAAVASVHMRAVGGCSCSNLLIASDALPLAVASNHFPSSIKVMSIAEVSKHCWSLACFPPVIMETDVKPSE